MGCSRTPESIARPSYALSCGQPALKQPYGCFSGSHQQGGYPMGILLPHWISHAVRSCCLDGVTSSNRQKNTADSYVMTSDSLVRGHRRGSCSAFTVSPFALWSEMCSCVHLQDHRSTTPSLADETALRLKA
jgi:hypothetical protein